MTTRSEDRERATRLLEALRGRALRQSVGDALVLVLGAASCAGLVGACFFSAACAIRTALAVFLLTALSAAVLIYWRTPGRFVAARRLEKRFPSDDGVLIAALDESLATDDSELAGETLSRALRLLEACDASSCDELRAVLYSCAVDPTALRRRALCRKRLYRVVPTLVLFFVLATSLAAFHDARRPETSEGVDGLARANEETSNVQKRLGTEGDLAVSGSFDHEGVAPTRTREGIETLLADLERALALARSLSVELARSDSGDVALALELARELDACVASSTGLIARASGVAEFAAASLRESDPDGRAVLPLLTTRRAGDLIAFFRDERGEQCALVSALSESLRGASDAERRGGRERAIGMVDELIARLADEATAFSILGEGWRFHDEWTSAEEVGESLRHEAVRQLTLRAGFDPDGRTEEAARDFFELVARRRVAWTTSLSAYEETATKLAAPENAGFLTFVRRVFQDVGLTESLLNADAQNVERYVEGAVGALDAARNEARTERWGKAATILNAAVRYDESDDESSVAAALALRLTFGELPESAGGPPIRIDAAPSDVAGEGAELDRPAKTVDERAKSDENASTRRALEREASLGETSAREGRAALVRRDELAVRDGSDGATSDLGARFDPNFAGSGAKTEENDPSRGYSDEEFVAELPHDVRKRVERAEKWSPPEEYKRRAEAFRRNLWKASREKER